MIKMSMTRAIMLIAIMFLTFNCFQMYFLSSQFIKETEISEKRHQKVNTLHDKTECQKYKLLVTTFVKSIPACF